MKINSKSAWSEHEIVDFVTHSEIPLRLATVDTNGYPLICSLWFYYDEGVFWSATHKNARVIELLKRHAGIGFEIATNDYPYKGVRGKADVELVREGAGAVLERLIDRYLHGSNRDLSDWLLSRKNDEYALKIVPITINAWDFSSRMTRRNVDAMER